MINSSEISNGGDAIDDVEGNMPCNVEGDVIDVEGEGVTSVVACTS